MDRRGLAALVTSRLRDITDFPKPGVLFKDFTPLLADPAAMHAVVSDVVDRFGGQVDLVAGIEARGFMIGTASAMALNVGFVPIRKEGKLPGPTVAASYELEYGSATIEMHRDVVHSGARVLVMDDVLATGGTAAAACTLIEQAGGVVTAVDAVVEIVALGGRGKLGAHRVDTLVRV